MHQFVYITVITLTIASTARAQTIGFEDVPVPTPPGYVNGSTGPGGATQFSSGGATFNNFYNPTFGNWAGWSVSRVTDVTTAGFGNQYAAYNPPSGTGDNSLTYAVGFYDTFNAVSPTIQLPAGTRPATIRLTNATYAALSMRDGDAFAKKFGGTSGNDPDFFLLTIQGFDALGGLTGTIPFYLADYRFANNSQDYILSQWTTVNLAALGNATRVTFSLDSSDHFIDTNQNPPVDFGMNTPAYFALDNLTVTPVPEPGSLALAALAAVAVARRCRRGPGRRSWAG
jgi:hypothetical protein